MDGPFITILPYAGKDGYYLVYDKINSVVDEYYGFYYSPPKKVNETEIWKRMMTKGMKYFLFSKI